MPFLLLPVLAAPVASSFGAELSLVQISDFSGTVRGIAQPAGDGAKACIAAYNDTPAGKALPAKLLTFDDHLDATQSRQLAQQAAASGAYAFINSVGAATSVAIAEVANAERMSLVGGITGSTSVRATAPKSMFFIRAGISHEARYAVRHLNTLGIRRIGVFHVEDQYGLDGLASARAAMLEAGIPEPATGSYVPVKALQAGEAVQRLQGQEAVIMFATGPALTDFVRNMRTRSPATMLIAASSANMASLIEAIGPGLMRGVGYLRSMPAPTPQTILGREFAEIWKHHGSGAAMTTFHLEGCVAAQAVLRAAAAGNVPRDRLATRLKESGVQSFGEFRLDFSSRNEGSSRVTIAVVDDQGRLRD